MREFKGELNAKSMRIAIVISRFNEVVTTRLLEGALDEFKRLGGSLDNVDVFWTPGSFEIPLALQYLAKSDRYDGLVALGAIVRGETPHFEYIASETAKGIAKVIMDNNIPVAFGIITADTLDQAIDRSGGKVGNKGRMAVQAVVEMVNLLNSIKTLS
ncbi:MAG: 6,7-dimethyl-8-ribityllumazine synthase [Candidatus Hydrothermota bacterium]|nr:MAG: 6,7-dimethyl-8-ribityllumazine synthase [Candidatus Hydrothermae bacterium]